MKKNIAEKLAIIRGMGAETLVSKFEKCFICHDPLNDDLIESRGLLREEIVRRCRVSKRVEDARKGGAQ